MAFRNTRGRGGDDDSDDDRARPHGREEAAGAAGAPETEEATQPEVRTAGLGALKLETFSGSRSPMVFRDWRMSVEAVQVLRGLSEAKLAVYVWMSLRGEAKDACRHLTLTQLNDDDGLKLLMACLEERYERQAFESYEHWHRRYERFRRTAGMPIVEYLTGLAQARQELRAVDATAVISDMSDARKMLNSGGLSKEEGRIALPPSASAPRW